MHIDSQTGRLAEDKVLFEAKALQPHMSVGLKALTYKCNMRQNDKAARFLEIC